MSNNRGISSSDNNLADSSCEEEPTETPGDRVKQLKGSGEDCDSNHKDEVIYENTLIDVNNKPRGDLEKPNIEKVEVKNGDDSGVQEVSKVIDTTETSEKVKENFEQVDIQEGVIDVDEAVIDEDNNIEQVEEKEVEVQEKEEEIVQPDNESSVYFESSGVINISATSAEVSGRGCRRI